MIQSPRLRAAPLLLALLGAAPALRAQDPPPAPQPPAPASAQPAWAGQASVLAVNALLGGVAGGVQRRLGGGRFADGFARGALGGGVVYAGKRIAVERWSGAGLLGREVGAVGASMVRNAGAGRAPLERVLLPLGPVNLYLEPRGSAPVRLRANALAVAVTAYAAARPELEWDAGASLSSGAMVFRAPRHDFRIGDEHAQGLGLPGTIFLSEPLGTPPVLRARSFAHERVHVLQADQAFLFVGEPTDAWVAARLPGLGRVRRYVDLNLTGALWYMLPAVIPEHDERPWEVEAIFLSERR